MSSSNLISDTIIALTPVVALICMYIYKLLCQKLPENQMKILQQIAEYAVHNIEQMSIGTAGAKKQQMAEEIIVNGFKELGLPIPPINLIRVAIESAVLLMNQLPEVAAAKKLSATRIQEKS